jgi:predicted DNA-binding transcriptional regulator AlpA
VSPSETSHVGRNVKFAEALRVLAVTRKTLHEWWKTLPGFPQPFRIGQRLFFDAAELERWRQAQRVGGPRDAS